MNDINRFSLLFQLTCVICLTYTTEGITSFSDAHTKTETVQPIGEPTVYDVNGIFNHDVDFIFLGDQTYEEIKVKHIKWNIDWRIFQ